MFGERIVSNTLSGDATTLGELKTAARRMNSVAIGVPVNTHQHGRAFHHCIGEIGAAVAIPYDDMRMILHRVFGTKPTDITKCLRLEAKLMYAFVINNVKRLRDDMVEAMAAEFKFTKEGKKVVEREFRIPHEYLCAYSASARNQADSEKNVYDGYPLSAMTSKTRSKGEAKFEKWCESADCVEWVYRNGDKEDEFFSIVYEDNSGHQRLFYPDYILRMDGEIWIIEIKGGWTASGASGNIDEYAAKKADVLAAYCRKHGLRGGFVCHDESEDVLLISEDRYSDDVKAACWHELKG